MQKFLRASSRYWMSSPKHILIGTIGLLIICICLPTGIISMMIDIDLGPFTLVLLSIALPLVLIPTIIIFLRMLRELLKTYNILKRKTAKEKLQRESTRQRIKLFLETSTPGVIWMIFQIFLTLLACLFFVIEAYQETTWTFIGECIFSLFFSIDYLLYFYCSQDRLEYFFTFFALIDFITIYPVLLSLFIVNLRSGTVFFRALRVLRSLRILRAYKILNFSHSGLQQQFFIVVLSIFSLLFCSTAIIQFVETYNNQLGVGNDFYYFHDCFYFIVVTFATVGGNIAPASILGQMVLICLILIAMFTIPYQSLKFMQLLTAKPNYSGRIPFHKDDGPRHIIVIGYITSTRILHLFRELFHEAQTYRNIRVVILTPQEPSEETMKLLWHPFYKTRIIYLVGSEFNKSDLRRADVAHAKACFILTDHYSVEPQQTYNLTMLRLLAIKDYAPNVRTYVQINNSTYYDYNDLVNTFIINEKELKSHIMAKNCIVPGFSAFISNLLATYSTKESNYNEISWRAEYHHGSSHEIYSFIIPSILQGMTFTEAVRFLYREHSIILFAIHMESSPNEITLNPGNKYTICSEETGYMIALDRSTAKDIEILHSTNFEEQQGVELKDILNESTSKFVVSLDPDDNEMLNTIKFDKTTSLLESILYSNGEIGNWNEILEDYSNEIIPQEETRLIDNIELSEHIVVFGNENNLISFIIPLRTVYNIKQYPILIVNPTEISSDIWNIIGKFTGIYTLIGSLENRKIQELSGLNNAKSLVLFIKEYKEECIISEADSRIILLYRMIHSIYPKLNIISELSNTENVRFIKPGLGTNHERHHNLTGLSNLSGKGRLLHPEYYYNRYYASGCIYSSSIIDSLLCHMISNKNINNLIGLLCTGGTNIDQFQRSSHIYSINIPIEFIGKEYSNIFEYYIKSDIIILGLYRRYNNTSYMYTNPKNNIIIKENDIGIILSSYQTISEYIK